MSYMQQQFSTRPVLPLNGQAEHTEPLLHVFSVLSFNIEHSAWCRNLEHGWRRTAFDTLRCIFS